MRQLKKLLPLLSGYRLTFILAMITVTLSQLFYAAGPIILSTAIDSVIGSEPATNPATMRIMEFLGGREVLRSSLWVLGLLIVANTGLRGVFLYLKGYYSAKASENISMNLRDRLYDHIQKLPYSYHVKTDTGDLIQRCTSDVETIRRFLGVQLVEVAGSLSMLFFILWSMLSLDRGMTLYSMVLVPVIFGFAYAFFKRIQRDFKEADEAEAKLSTTLQENLTGIRVVKAFAREAFELEKFDTRNLSYRNSVNKLIDNLAVYWSLSDFLSMFQVGLVIVAGSIMVVQGRIAIGVLVAFISYVNMLIWPVRQLGRVLTDMGKATVSIDRVDEILSIPQEPLVVNGLEPEIRGEIEFKNVSFSYDGNRDVLHDISFHLKKGDTVAIMGPTGAGKSTLVNLLPRLYDYTSGSIKVDGNELKEIDRHWIRKNIALVLQEPFLYARTIKENIRFTDPEKQDKSVFQAAKVASIHNDIISFDKKYETMVGERGVSLSGGQKQRMAIARAIIAETPIVIFDDSLSAVDTETDMEIRKALEKRKNIATTFVISHRISTVSNADKIIVLDKGRIIQSGTHSELISQEGLYRRIYDIQSSVEMDVLNA
ncbi:ABC transporter ATP-binding protein [Gudongella sp. SC589]|uniref:ABC transporter ATP-binding protein n=1 Tax=Gudongella sp. SC589 TaxID=3385990 RepID=UPI003904BE72